MYLTENIKNAANWNNISPMVLDNLVYLFSDCVVDNTNVNYKGDHVSINHMYDIMDAETVEQIEQDIFEIVCEDKKTIDFAVEVINNSPEGHDYSHRVASAMWDVVNDNDYDNDYTHAAVKRAYRSFRWNIKVEISDDNAVSVNIGK